MSHSKTKILLSIYWKTAAWALFILIASAIPGNNIDKVRFINIPYFDKIVHAAFYFILYFLFLTAQKKRSNINTWMFVFLGFAVFFYSFFIEILQYSIFRNRSFEIGDLIANSLGIILCYMFFKNNKAFIEKYLKLL